MARAQTRDAEPDDGYIPFLQRFKRWWAGDDVPELESIEVVERGDEEDAGPNTITVEPKTPKQPEDDGRTWPDTRIEFCRRLWALSDDDDEMVEPGGAAYCNELMQPAALSSSKSALDLSAGLGGGVRFMVGGLGLYITASEPDKELARTGQQISTKRGLGKRAPIAHYDPETLELPENKFHAVLIRDRLYRMETKHSVLQTIRKTLKPGGILVLTDFVANDDIGDDGPLSAWSALEPQEPTLWTADAYRDALESMDLQIRTFESGPDAYRNMIRAGWARFIDGLTRKELTQDFVDSMMREAEYWLSLDRALESGELVRLHIVASTPRAEVER